MSSSSLEKNLNIETGVDERSDADANEIFLKETEPSARMHEALHQTGIYDFFERN